MRVSPLILAVLAAACAQPPRLVVSDADRVLTGVQLEAPNPGLPGPLPVAAFHYGSGTDRRRAAYRDSVTVRTTPVNATPFLRDIDAKALRRRWRYWGFDARALPRNGRVWHPEGAGPYPLVLMVHGNHDMKDFSDPGYEWLGRHLASRGYIAVSVDENFLNGGIRTENDARAWMLLQHLALWRRWATDPGFPLHGRVDLSRIALIGHSRGGDAVAIASGFNRLTHWPDDARIRFDFGFDLKAIIAIAPVDGQYNPSDKLPPVRGVNYFVMHGSHDSDVSTFIGQRTFLRTDVSDPASVKAALYVYRANHGQWNTVWGDNDVGEMGRWLAKRSLLSGEEQRDIGRIFFSGFLELAVRGDRRYEPMFRDHRTVGAWLPRTLYVSQFASGGERRIATFEEDIDVTTATAGSAVAARGLTLWREGSIPTRATARGATFETTAVYLGWSAPTDSTAVPDPDRAWYEVALPTGAIDPDARLTFSLAQLALRPGPLSVRDTLTPDTAVAAPSAGRDPSGSRARASRATRARSAADAARRARLPADSLRVDFSVELLTHDGRRATVPLSEVVALRPPLTIRLYRHAYIETRVTGSPRDHEYALQRVEVPFARFVAALPGLTPAAVRAVRFRFDRTTAGAIVLDDIGIESP
jgi:dienelactone hydrolase